MSPKPPPSSEGSSLPSRHRPAMDDLDQDTTERDLWDLDDDMDLPEDVAGKTVSEATRAGAREIPGPREPRPPKPRESGKGADAKPGSGGDRIRIDVNKRVKESPSGTPSGAAKPESDFDELEHWEDIGLEPEIEELPDSPVEETPDVIADNVEPEVGPAEVDLPATETVADDGNDEFSPAYREDAERVSLRPLLQQLPKIEKIGLIVLFVLLLGGGGTFFLWSLHRLPVERQMAETHDFPIKGERVAINSATTYWRRPVTDGPDADTFRRGTELLPVVELAVTGGPAALRVLFRGDDQTVIGDVVTRSVHGTELLKIPATAGFDEPGMHAAYRTSESKPWTAEVYEAASVDAEGKDFKKLFEMNISTDRR